MSLQDLVFSPDGRYVAAITGSDENNLYEGTLVVAPLAGGRLLTVNRDVYRAAWAPPAGLVSVRGNDYNALPANSFLEGVYVTDFP